VFGDIDCISPEVSTVPWYYYETNCSQQSFTNLPIERFSLSAATQYYQPLERLDDFVEYAKHKLCYNSGPDCQEQVSSLLSASSVDIDFDTISHALTVTAFWPPQARAFNISNTGPKDRLEVGVLSVESPKEPEELTLGGFLTVVGEDTKPKPTLFSFPARHHPFISTFSAEFLTPTGLHPTLGLQISSSALPTEERSCSFHAHLTLPRSIFADKYQLSDPLFLASKNLSSIHYITTPVDLEAPAYAMSLWGSSVLIELAPPSEGDTLWTAAIPLHLRYLPPASGTSGQKLLDIPSPVVFWACVADEGSKFPINPFDKVNIGYEGLFGPKTMFYHLSPEGDILINTISVPVLDLDQSKYVELGTAAVVLLGFSWVLWSLWSVWKNEGYGSGVRTLADKKKA
jgi:hypothetical protein